MLLCIAGDSDYKPYVCAEPEVCEVSLDGSEDFLILACDGLWDFVSTRQAAKAVYDHLAHNPGKPSSNIRPTIPVTHLLIPKVYLFFLVNPAASAVEDRIVRKYMKVIPSVHS